MADGIDIDFSDFSKLAVDIGEVPPEAGKNLHAAVEVTATDVRDTARENAAGMLHAPAFPRSITYDIGSGYSFVREMFGGGGADSITAEIGPDKDRPQGALGNLIEYGSVNNPPRGIMHGALQAHEANLESGVAKALDAAHKAAGL
ncbi:hypothetical protein [Microbacterium maritypicum]